jgi:hypothetical protein
MRQELFTDIDPDIKLALQTRKKRFTGKKDIREYSKSAFVRAFPLSIAELASTDPDFEEIQSEAAKITATVERYTLGMQTGGVRDPLSSYKNKYNRPVPGITGLSAQFEGFSGKGLVKIQLKGVINTLEDLDIYKPVLFTPGKYWMLEWGYIPHKGDGITDNLITIGDAYTLYAQKRIGDVFKLAEEHRKITKGTSEIQVAVVNNYEYTLNAAGSFEFTVDFTGNSTLFKNLQSGAVGSGFLAEVVTVTDAEGNPATAEQIEQVEKNLAQGAEPDKETITILWDNVPDTKDVVHAVAGDRRTFDKSIVETFKAATPADFFKGLKNYIIECNQSSGIDTSPLPGNFSYSTDTTGRRRSFIDFSWGDTEIFFGEEIKSTGIYYDSEKAPIFMGGQKFDYNDFNNEIGPYVTWGWFEDNILNVVYGKNRDTSHPVKWESIDQEGKPLPLNSHKYLYTTTPDKLIIPGRMPEMLETTWDSKPGPQDGLSRGETGATDIRLTDAQYNVGPSFGSPTATGTVFEESDMLQVDKVFGAYHPIVHDYIRISETALGFDTDISINESDAVGGGLIDITGLDANELADMTGYVTDQDLYDERETLIRTESDKRGSIRRLILHYRLIQDSFVNAATPIEGLKTLLNKIEGMGYRGFWDFGIFEVDDKIGVYEKNSLSAYSDYAIEKVRAQVKAGKLDSKQQTKTPPLGEVFVFPTWNKDGGFVLNQNLTVKMPSNKMLAMVYASSLEGRKTIQNKSFGDTDDAQLFSVISAGESFAQKINVEPGFQGSTIDIVKSIDLGGNIIPARIGKRTVLTKRIGGSNPIEKEGHEFRYVGEKKLQIDNSEGSIFSTGVAIDAHGIMYENVKQVMNYRLQKSWMKIGGNYTKMTSRDTRVLDMAELSIKIQGISGLNWGNQFHTDYIEERFKKEIVFFITKVNHEISEGNWTTEIVGGMRSIFNSDYVKEAVSISEAENRFIDIKLSDADSKLINKMKENHQNILIHSGRMHREARSLHTKDGLGWYTVKEE